MEAKQLQLQQRQYTVEAKKNFPIHETIYCIKNNGKGPTSILCEGDIGNTGEPTDKIMKRLLKLYINVKEWRNKPKKKVYQNETTQIHYEECCGISGKPNPPHKEHKEVRPWNPSNLIRECINECKDNANQKKMPYL